jgi:DNA end-binding protein Ku
VPRSIWNGALSFAGIDVPVKAFGAADPQGVQFRELHEPDGAEIAHELVDADGRISYTSPALKYVLGYEADALKDGKVSV